jgi:hypothetical protein
MLLVLFAVTSNGFVTFKIAVTSNYNGTVTGNEGKRIKSSYGTVVSFTSNGSKVTPLHF